MDENKNPNPNTAPSEGEIPTPNTAPPQKDPVARVQPTAVPPTPIPTTPAPQEGAIAKVPKKGQPKDDLDLLAPRKKVSAWTLLRWFIGFGGILLAIFYVLLLWGLLGGNVSNPLFQALNIQETDLQSTLLALTNYIFGFLAIFFLIGTLIKFFQWLMLGRDAVNRGEYGKKSAFFFAIFVVSCVVWVALFWLITNANAEHKQITTSIIRSKPDKLIGLNAPVTVEFDVGTELFKQIDPDLVRQINWDFNSDGTYDATGPQVTYRFLKKGPANGKYNVMVVVDYYSPSAQTEKTYTAERQVVIVNEAVQAVISADKEEGPIPLTVQFSAKESNDPDGDIVLYEWDLDGDGVYEILGADKTELKHTYSKVGEVTVSLRTTGSNNDTSIAQKVIFSRQSEENIQASITSEKGFEGVPPFEVNLSGEQSYTRFGNIVSYQWQIQGEEALVPGRKLQRIFRTPGEYMVSLIIENDVGERDKVDQVIRVVPQLSSVKLGIVTVPPTEEGKVLRGVAPFEVQVSADASQIHNPVEWQWDFESDGIIDSSNQTGTYVYRESGEYDLTLTVVDSFENKITAIQKIVVDRAGVQARITANPSYGTVPLTVAFDGSASTTDKGEIVLYTWQFPGKEPIPTGAKLSYEFDGVGTFPVKLTVLTSEQEIAETQTLISVRSLPLGANFETIPNIENPLSIQFDPTNSTGTVSEYLWNFGDGEVSKAFMPTHTYGFAGEFDVTLKITDPKGVVSSATKKIQVGQ